MKTTGVTRKIDELGRIVIPKEIRRNLGIRDGENLEIYIDDDAICLKKHYQMHGLEELCDKLCSMLSALLNVKAFICDKEKIIATSENLNNLKNKKIDKFLINLIDNRESYSSDIKTVFEFEGTMLDGYYSCKPIITSIDSLGLIVLISENKIDVENVIKLVAKILSDKLDIC